jgi:hypothetical protein
MVVQMRLADERGVLLLEALVALTIMSSAIIVLIGVHSAAGQAQARAAAEERIIGDADRLLAAMTLLRRAEFDQRLGRREIGRYLVEVERPEPGLYRLGIRELAHPEVELLATVVAREETAP